MSNNAAPSDDPPSGSESAHLAASRPRIVARAQRAQCGCTEPLVPAPSCLRDGACRRFPLTKLAARPAQPWPSSSVEARRPSRVCQGTELRQSRASVHREAPTALGRRCSRGDTTMEEPNRDIGRMQRPTQLANFKGPARRLRGERAAALDSRSDQRVRAALGAEKRWIINAQADRSGDAVVGVASPHCRGCVMRSCCVDGVDGWVSLMWIGGSPVDPTRTLGAGAVSAGTRRGGRCGSVSCSLCWRGAGARHFRGMRRRAAVRSTRGRRRGKRRRRSRR